MVVLGPGLGAHGIWGEAELPRIERSLARIGEAHGTFPTAPVGLDVLRGLWISVLRSLLGLETAARTFDLIAVAFGGALVAAWAPRRPGAVFGTVVALAVYLGLPSVAVSGSAVLGDPWGEICIVAAASATAAFVGADDGRRRFSMAVAAVAFVAAAVHVRGLGWGAALPLLAAAFGPNGSKRMRAAVATAGACCLAATCVLAVRQEDGYLPILAAAKTEAFLDDPAGVDVVAGIGAFLHQTWPVTPLALLGVVAGRTCPGWLRAYLVLAVAAAVPWCLVYGVVPLPVTVATALVVAHAADDGLASSNAKGRLIVALVLGAWVALAKDGRAYPAAYVNLFGPPLSGTFFPAEALDLGGRIARSIHVWILAAAAAALALHRGRLRLASAAVAFAAVFGAVIVPHGIVRPTLARLSLAPLLATHREAVEAGALPPRLATLRVDAPELELYAGATTVEAVNHRRKLATLFAAGAPYAALVRKTDLAGLFQLHRQDHWPLFVLDDRHAWARLVANVLPPGLEDRNRLPHIVLDAPVQLEHETLVRFEDAIEILGWEIEGPVVRGARPKVRVLLHVIGPVPASAKLIFRLQAGRTSRIGAEPVELTGGAYPPGYFRPGDYILHEHEMRVPIFEILTGPHVVVVGMRRNEKRNLRITAPAGRDPEAGARIFDRAHHFAAIGTVMVL